MVTGVHESGRARENCGYSPVNLALEAISINISALPTVTSAASPQASGQRGSGFASTLAAAQNFSTPPQSAAGAVTEIQSAGATNLNLGVLTKGIVQPKKLPSSSAPVATTSAPAGNVLVPAFIPESASQIALAAPQLGFTQSSLTSTPMAQSAPLSSSASAQTAGISGSLTSIAHSTEASGLSTTWEQVARSAVSSAADSGSPGSSFANGLVPAQLMLRTDNPQSTALPVTQAPPSSIANSPNVAVGAPESGPQSVAVGLGTGAIESTMLAPTVLARNIQPPVLAFTAGQTSPSAALQTAVAEAPESGQQTDPPEPGIAAAVVTSTNQAIAAAMPAPVLLASTSAPVGPALGVLPSAETNLPSVPANASDTVATESGNQDNVALPAGTANALSAIIHGQNIAPSILNFPAQPLPGRALPQIAAPRTAAGGAAPSVRTSSSSLSTGSDAANESSVANQTPFSVFFSNAGPGTEAAASTLPKMILPATSAQTSGAQAGSPPSVSSPGIISPNNVAQNAAPQSSKNSPTVSQSGTLLGGQALHGNVDQGASNAPAALQTPAAPPAPLAPAAAAVAPAGGQPMLSADSLPAPQTSAGNAAGGANLTPAAPPAPTVLPGPVQVAQLVNRVGQSEMRIGMNTSAFGGIEVRTVVHANDVGLVIGSEKGDLRGLLSNEMPAIANTLQQQNLRLNSVSFMQGFASSNNASGGGGSQQQRSFVPAPTVANAVSSEAAVDSSGEALAAMEYSSGGGGLSILA